MGIFFSHSFPLWVCTDHPENCMRRLMDKHLWGTVSHLIESKLTKEFNIKYVTFWSIFREWLIKTSRKASLLQMEMADASKLVAFVEREIVKGIFITMDGLNAFLQGKTFIEALFSLMEVYYTFDVEYPRPYSHWTLAGACHAGPFQRKTISRVSLLRHS